MAMYEDDEFTFWALVGNTGSRSWADTAMAFMSFYHLFFKGFRPSPTFRTLAGYVNSRENVPARRRTDGKAEVVVGLSSIGAARAPDRG